MQHKKYKQVFVFEACDSGFPHGKAVGVLPHIY